MTDMRCRQGPLRFRVGSCAGSRIRKPSKRGSNMAISAIESVLQQLTATAQDRRRRCRYGCANGIAGGGRGRRDEKTLERISNGQQHAAGQAEAFELGKPGVSLNDVMIDLQKANVGFQMGLQVRNRVVAAYQERNHEHASLKGSFGIKHV